MPLRNIPVLDLMQDLYLQPRSFERFKEYLHLLQGDTKDELVLPIVGFNPMAKDHLVCKIQELQGLEAEIIAKEVCNELDSIFTKAGIHDDIKLVLNLADDLKGVWTNQFTTDYDSKFKISGLANRNFTVPYFWSSENYTKDLIFTRTKEYLLRTLHFKLFGKPLTLKQHVQQEIFVAKHVKFEKYIEDLEIYRNHIDFFNTYQDTENYNSIFCFFYGDEIASNLRFPLYGLSGSIVNGFMYSHTYCQFKNLEP